jgi:hypothetical protein
MERREALQHHRAMSEKCTCDPAQKHAVIRCSGFARCPPWERSAVGNTLVLYNTRCQSNNTQGFKGLQERPTRHRRGRSWRASTSWCWENPQDAVVCGSSVPGTIDRPCTEANVCFECSHSWFPRQKPASERDAALGLVSSILGR